MPIRTTKPLTRDQRLAYQLVAAVKKFIDPQLGFRDIRVVPVDGAAVRFGYTFVVPARDDPHEPRSLRVEVRGGEVRLDFRRGKWARSQTFDVSAPDFEREVAEFIGKHWDCYFSTHWMSV